MGLMSELVGGGVQGILGGANDIVKSIWGSKSDRDAASANEVQSIQDGYQAEFLAPEKKNWFNILVDGANRLVRPLCTYGIVAFFWWACVDPLPFSVAMQAMALVPQMFWYIAMTILTFWFGGRMVEGITSTLQSGKVIQAPDPSKVAAVVQAQQQLQTAADTAQANHDALKAKQESDAADALAHKNYTEDKYQAEMKDEKKPLSNLAIEEWNKRQGSAGKGL